jgi:hypothetical protein
LVSGIKRALAFCGAAALAVACGQRFSSSTSSAQGGTDGNGNAGEPAAAGTEAGGSASGSAAEGGKGGSAQGGRGGEVTSGGRMPIGGDVSIGGDISVGGGVVTGGNGGSGGSEPSPIPSDGLELWLRAEQGITLRDNAVAVWKDGSLHHRDATQTANNYQPAVAPNWLGGKPGVGFDGIDDHLTLPALDTDFSKGLSLFIVLERDTSPNSCEGFFEASNGPEIDDLHFGDWKNSFNFEINETWINDTNYPLLSGAPQVAVALKDPAGDTQLRSNSNGAGQGSTDPIQVVKRTQVFLARTLYGDCGSLHGIMGEVLLYSRRVSDQELLDIEAYLQKKWGCCSG